MTDPQRLLKTAETAELLGLSPAARETRRTRGGGPCFVKLGRSVRYRQGDLEEYIKSGVRQDTSEKGGAA